MCFFSTHKTSVSQHLCAKQCYIHLCLIITVLLSTGRSRTIAQLGRGRAGVQTRAPWLWEQAFAPQHATFLGWPCASLQPFGTIFNCKKPEVTWASVIAITHPKLLAPPAEHREKHFLLNNKQRFIFIFLKFLRSLCSYFANLVYKRLLVCSFIIHLQFWTMKWAMPRELWPWSLSNLLHFLESLMRVFSNSAAVCYLLLFLRTMDH